MQQQPTFNFGLTNNFFYLLHTQYAAKNQKLSKSGVKRKKKIFKFYFQVTYPDGFGLCKKREQKILTLGHLTQKVIKIF
jgi:hypothetical protein